MEELLLILVFGLLFIGIPILLGVLIYKIPKKLGYDKLSNSLTISYVFVLLVLVGVFVFEDKLFGKNSALQSINEVGVDLNDDFELTENKTMWAFGDYYHVFELNISPEDKERLIFDIRNAKNFESNVRNVNTRLDVSQENDVAVNQNYQTENQYIRESYEPSKKEGIAPMFKRISISKLENKLKYEYIVE